jgi:hypothetical protein
MCSNNQEASLRCAYLISKITTSIAFRRLFHRLDAGIETHIMPTYIAALARQFLRSRSVSADAAVMALLQTQQV